MNNKRNLIVILLILIIPVVFYYVQQLNGETKSPALEKVIGVKPVVIDFSSKLCLECQQLKATLTPLEEKYKNKIVFKQVNINSNDKETLALVKKYKINVVPTLVFINKSGKTIKIVEGYEEKNRLESNLKSVINE